MIIDDKVVLKYLQGDTDDEIKNHWVFKNIEKEKHMFENPNLEKKEKVHELSSYLQEKLSNFKPLNKNIFTELYPEWEEIADNMNVLLIVGCPDPYDAMVKEHEGKQYMVLDLIRFNSYLELGYDLDSVISQLLTHELSHLCLHKKYPVPSSEDYVEKLKYIVFDEAFAHLLAFKENINNYDFSNMIKEHYNDSFVKLKDAIAETDIQKQNYLLIESNSGQYWNKFAAISGKLFLANHIQKIQELYDNGVDNFIKSMGL